MTALMAQFFTLGASMFQIHPPTFPMRQPITALRTQAVSPVSAFSSVDVGSEPSAPFAHHAAAAIAAAPMTAGIAWVSAGSSPSFRRRGAS